MTTEEKNQVLTGKPVEVAVFETADDTCETVKFETVKVRMLKLNKYEEASTLLDDWFGICRICTGQPKEWFDRLHPESLNKLYDACLEVNKNGFFLYCEKKLQERMKSVDAISPQTLEKLDAIGRRVSQKG